MRSLPPPRVTRKRRWRRFKRAVNYFFHHGKFSDPNSYDYRNKSQTISKIKRGRITSRLKRSNLTKSDALLRKSTNAGFKTAGVMGRLATKSMPILRSNSRNSLNVSVNLN